ncbi:MAG: hypothetical protein K9M45_00360 [Kiritimatiellales bacterium]|nr:hypothetical protein [Kiritimatiellales bacterium]
MDRRCFSAGLSAAVVRRCPVLLRTVCLVSFLFVFAASSSVSATQLYVVDVRDNPDGFRYNRAKRALLQSFQGVVNKWNDPLLFVIHEEDPATELDWLDALVVHKGVTFSYVKPWDVFSIPEFKARCNSVYLYDSAANPVMETVAITAAGQNNRAMVDNDQGVIDMITAAPYNFTVCDWRDSYVNDPAAAQLWNRNHWLRSNKNTDVYAINDSFSVFPRGMDYMIQQGMFTWVLDAAGRNLSDFATTQCAIMKSFGPITPVYGWWTSEGPDIHALGKNGHVYAGWGNNDSVYKWFPAETPLAQPVRPLPAYSRGKRYVLISFTQGDTSRRSTYWNQRCLTAISDDGSGKRIAEKYPFGMTQMAHWLDRAAFIPWCQYNLEQGNGTYMCGRGAGYAFPTDLHNNGYLQNYCRQTDRLFPGIGMQDFFLKDPDGQKDPEHTVIKYIIGHTTIRSIISINQLDVANGRENDEVWEYKGVPVFADPVKTKRDGKKNIQIQKMRDAINNDSRRFFWVFLDNPVTPREFEDVCDGLQSDIVLCSTDEFVRLYLASRTQ